MDTIESKIFDFSFNQVSSVDRMIFVYVVCFLLLLVLLYSQSTERSIDSILSKSNDTEEKETKKDLVFFKWRKSVSKAEEV
jgi:hypothetical protein